MRVVRQISQLDIWNEGTIGFVPTMGAFHEGHLSLMRAAREECDLVVVSIFVNPLQFGPAEDFERYPRDEPRDFAMAESAGADVVFAPAVEEIYPQESTKVVVPSVGDRWEGAHRPGHFDGVATVVCKLFNIVRPAIAFFGLKDFQQCKVVQRMVEDLNMPVRLAFLQTVREGDGLALSSRNAYLSPQDRVVAPEIRAQLERAERRIIDKNEPVDAVISDAMKALMAMGFAVDYFALVDNDSLEPLSEYRPEAALIAAAKIGKTRLIDSLPILP